MPRARSYQRLRQSFALASELGTAADSYLEDLLAGLARWPVTISYFDKSKHTDDQPSEQTPIYAISFEMYENGISRALRLDYGDFVIDGKMSSLEVKKAKACK